MTDLKAYALATVIYALESEASAKSDDLRNHAEALIAIADANDVRIEALLAWIHTRTPGKEWSLAEWRGFCAAVLNEEGR